MAFISLSSLWCMPIKFFDLLGPTFQDEICGYLSAKKYFPGRRFFCGILTVFLDTNRSHYPDLGSILHLRVKSRTLKPPGILHLWLLLGR